MTVEAIAEQLNSIFTEVDGTPVEIKTDYRKLQARYICTSGENCTLCLHFLPDRSGLCGHLQIGGFCGKGF